ncbi:CheR family methyltransferase [Chrysiogenes arsenatis]|uniref:CheR family methyltransferase n=1 Tax=Chrysiogenes arsenatis TaxID=309797 RepID=UPI000413CDC6|nr:protein-glutamate O-methyltransferase [Chrysiogenes arsenatis]
MAEVDLAIFRENISDADFKRLKEYIESHCGIKLGDTKRQMVEGRLRKRLREHGFASYREYLDFVFHTPQGEDEIISLIDVLTTNKTDFFREPAHFDFLVGHAIPEIIPLLRRDNRRIFKVWSAGCSTGEEPYTLAMVLFDALASYGSSIDFSILATDISTQVLEKAHQGIYDQAKVESQIPSSLQRKFMLRSKDRSRKLMRFAPEVRSRLSFKRLNFMDATYGLKEKFDVIFCRNVLIYFDKKTQEAILRKQIAHLSDDGYLFLGHSETLNGMNLPLRGCYPTVYKKI